jgi:hypothetical protein
VHAIYAVYCRSARGGKSLLGTCRLVLLTTKHFVNAPAMIVRAPTGAAGTATGISSAVVASSTTAVDTADPDKEVGKFLVILLCPEGFTAPADAPIVGALEEVPGGDREPVQAVKVKPKKMFDPFEDLSKRVSARGSSSSSGDSALMLQQGQYGHSSGRTYAVVETSCSAVVCVGRTRIAVDGDAVYIRCEKTAIATAIKVCILMSLYYLLCYCLMSMLSEMFEMKAVV